LTCQIKQGIELLVERTSCMLVFREFFFLFFFDNKESVSVDSMSA